MTDNWTDRLSEYLDGTLAPPERTALESHLTSCAACAATLEELRRVVARAQRLEDRAPAADLWPGVAERIGLSTTVVDLGSRRARRRFSFTVPQLAAAGIAFLMLGSGVAWLGLRHSTRAGSIGLPTQGPTVIQASWADSAIATVDMDVTELRNALDAGRRTGRIDSATVRVLERSLATIDSAVVQARRALAADPNSAYLNQYLAKTLRRKSEFVRRAGAIVSARIT
jgi:predicted anti-sigma-YlaC factor YlaD